MGAAATTFGLVFLVCLATYLAVTQCSSRQEAHDTAVRLRADSTVIANRERDAQLRLSENQAREDRATAKALIDEKNREKTDNNTALLIAAMSRPQQNDAALQYLITGGFLNKPLYEGKSVQISPDSNITRAVATQGKVLIDTRQQLVETNQALRQSIEEVSDLELIKNYVDHSITNTRMYLQDRRAERGFLRGKSRREFGEGDRQLGEIQKYIQQSNPKP